MRFRAAGRGPFEPSLRKRAYGGIFWAALGATAFGAFGADAWAARAATPAPAPLIVVTTPALGDLVREFLGPLATDGRKARVEVLFHGDQDPHRWLGGARVQRLLSQAQVLLLNGRGLENSAIPGELAAAANERVIPGHPGYWDASDALAKTAATPAPGPSSRPSAQPSARLTPRLEPLHAHADGDPHFMTDPESARAVARWLGQKLAAEFEKTAAKAAIEIAAREKKWEAALDRREQSWRARLSRPVGAPVLSYHAGFAPFLNWAKIKYAGALEAYPGYAPDPAQWAVLKREAQRLKVRAILIEPFRPRGLTDQLARELRARVVVVPPEAASAEVGQGAYFKWIDRIVNAVSGEGPAPKNASRPTSAPKVSPSAPNALASPSPGPAPSTEPSTEPSSNPATPAPIESSSAPQVLTIEPPVGAPTPAVPNPLSAKPSAKPAAKPSGSPFDAPTDAPALGVPTVIPSRRPMPSPLPAFTPSPAARPQPSPTPVKSRAPRPAPSARPKLEPLPRYVPGESLFKRTEPSPTPSAGSEYWIRPPSPTP